MLTRRRAVARIRLSRRRDGGPPKAGGGFRLGSVSRRAAGRVRYGMPGIYRGSGDVKFLANPVRGPAADVRTDPVEACRGTVSAFFWQ